jgi:hypothetical protein
MVPGGVLRSRPLVWSRCMCVSRYTAGRHGFRLSYPRDNPHGVIYEPWHWFRA